MIKFSERSTARAEACIVGDDGQAGVCVCVCLYVCLVSRWKDVVTADGALV